MSGPVWSCHSKDWFHGCGCVACIARKVPEYLPGMTKSPTIRVIQWATGTVGIHAVPAIVAHPQLELAGLWVHSDSKAGRDAGELCGGPSAGARPRSCTPAPPH